MSKLKTFVGGLVVGGIIGVLLAPKSGEESRKELKEKIEDLTLYIKNIDSETIKLEATKKLNNIRKYLEENDGSEMLEDLKDKSKEILKNLDDLAKMFKEKTDPYAQKLIGSTKELTINVLNKTLEKLEN